MKYKSELFILFTILVNLTACSPHKQQSMAPQSVQTNETKVILKNAPLIHDVKFNVAKVNTTIESFEAHGFELGDSVNATFDNGTTTFILEDIPYYNGFYVRQGAPMIVGYPGKTYLYIGYNDAEDIWNIAQLDNQSTVTITLNQKGKYRNVQETFQLVYSDDRKDFNSDIEFANFRDMRGGNLKPNTFYRSASPCDNQHNRAPYVDALMQANHVQYVLNFSDSQEKAAHYPDDPKFSSPYFKELYQNDRISFLDLSSNYRLLTFKQTVASSLTKLVTFDPPYLAHCVEGKDRTGFISIIIESLCGASYDEMKDDYMKTYEIYYGVTEQNRPESYHAIVELLFDPMLLYISEQTRTDTLTKLDFNVFATQYLREGGMQDEHILQLKARICQAPSSLN